MARFASYAPDFRVRINGEDLPAAVRSTLTSVRYEDGWNAADRVELGFANPDLRWLQRHIQGLGFQPVPTGFTAGPARLADAAPEGTFDLENTLELALGYAPDPLAEVFAGDVTGVQVGFPNKGMPTLTLVAHDRLQRLAEGKASRGFGPVPDMLVASILSAESLLAPLIDPDIAAASSALNLLHVAFGGSGMKQAGESGLQLLQRIAKKYDADFFVEGDVLRISRFVRDDVPQLTLAWGESLREFSPKVSTVGQVAAVAMRFTLREIPLTFLVTVSWDFNRESLGVSIVPGKATVQQRLAGGPTLTVIDQPISSPADIAASALVIHRELRNRLNTRLTGSGSAVGDPRIRAGAVVRLEGLGPDFSGSYRVKSATHSIDSGGYQTKFEVYKEVLP